MKGFEEQADDLKQLVGYDEQAMLKEVYDEEERQAQEKEMLLNDMKSRMREINALLDSYSVPKELNGFELSILERIECALKERIYAAV